MEHKTEKTPYDIYVENQSMREFIVLIAKDDLDMEFELMEQHGVMTDETKET